MTYETKILSNQAKMFTRGMRVMCNGYEGTVTKVCEGQLTGMLEIRVPGGVACVGTTEVIRESRKAGLMA